MKNYTAKEIREELKHSSHDELMLICQRLIRFKKENKELLSYLLFKSSDEEVFVEEVKTQIAEQFLNINKKSYFFMRKSVRKILTDTKKYIRYSSQKETEIELLLHFCKELKNLRPSMKNHLRLHNIYLTQTKYIQKKIDLLHEDLQFDYNLELNELLG